MYVGSGVLGAMGERMKLEEIEAMLDLAEMDPWHPEEAVRISNADIRDLVDRVRVLELDVMRVDVVLEAAKAVVEDGNYDVHFENRSAALIDSGLLLRLENAVNALSVKEST